MNTNGYRTAVEIVEYLAVNRAVGHTTAMIEGANANCLILAHNQQWADELAKKTDATCISIQQVHTGVMRGMKKPLLLDNAATIALLGDLVGEIATLRKENKDLRKENQSMDDKIRLAKLALQ